MSDTQESYRLGQEWVQRAHDAYARIGTDTKAADRAGAAALIATAHFTAASVTWGEPEPGTPLEPVPERPGSAVTYGPWTRTPPERT